jgi:glycine/D-amino acid oxidase-like deaminating enzyme/nitrite reductase/ring-hydroxylating ferredoxin subunit
LIYMTSLWLDRTDTFSGDEFSQGEAYDTVVVGAGLTGLVTALLLARSGKNVLVLEARSLGAVTTGNTTAKVTLLQGTVLSGLRHQYPEKIVDAYVAANREGQAWLLRYLETRRLPFQERDAYTYATTPKGAETLRAELAVALAAGIEVDYVRDAGLPFPVRGSLRLRGQAQINPMDVVLALAEDVRSHGGTIVSGVRVQNVSGTGPSTVETDRGTVRANEVVLATGTPILNRGLYFAKLKPNRSYAAALELSGSSAPPEGMYLSVEQPVRSLRDYPTDGRRLLLVGGNGHPVGTAGSEQAHLDELLTWAGSHFPDSTVTHTWSAQDYQATNLMPFFGKLPRGRGRIFFATGYNKWGMTNAVAASLGIAADILGGHLPWADAIHRRVTSPPGAASAVVLNAGVAATIVKDWGKAGLKKLPPDGTAAPAEGTGIVALRGRKPVATSTVNGASCSLSAVCTHLGGIVRWNDNEKSWDCPLHGSRFSSDGQLLEGPATHNLPPAG